MRLVSSDLIAFVWEDGLCVPQGDFVIMDGPDIQRLYEVCCDPYHALPIVDYFPPIIA